MKIIWEETDIRGGLKFTTTIGYGDTARTDTSVIGRSVDMRNYDKPFVFIHDGYLITQPMSAAEAAETLNKFQCQPAS